MSYKDIKPIIGPIRGRKIIQYGIDGKFIAEHETMEEVRKALKRKSYPGGIAMVARKKAGYAYGFQWRYADDVEQS